jgi:hypothetical protein
MCIGCTCLVSTRRRIRYNDRVTEETERLFLAAKTMPESRGRKKKRKEQQQLPSQNQQQLPWPHHRTRWEKIRDHPVPWLIGLIAGILAIGAFFQQTFVSPEISAFGEQDPSAPFDLPFNVKNNSSLFAMRTAQLRCTVDEVIFKTGSSVKYITFAGNTITINPGDEGEFRCLIGRNGLVNFGTGEIQSAHMFLWIAYRTLGIPRSSPMTEFTWFTQAKSPRWVRGKIAH